MTASQTIIQHEIFFILVECPCVAMGVDFLNAEKRYTRTNHDANQTFNWIPTV